jgi:hypothetical protein
MPEQQPHRPGRNHDMLKLGHISPPKPHQEIVAKLASCVSGPTITIETLEAFLTACPQVIGGKTRYLVSGGFAVDITTGQTRAHKDIDIVLLSKKDASPQWCSCKLDAVQPETYFGHMNLTSEVFLKSARRLTTRPNEMGIPVAVVHPAILLVQKSSDFYGKAPRHEDAQDARALADQLKREVTSHRDEWRSLIFQGFSGLEDNVRPKTLSRLAPVLRYLQITDQ